MERTERNKAVCELAFDVTHRWGSVHLKLYGTSMVPFLWPGDLVTVRFLARSEFRSGQIAVYLNGDGLTAHRILSVKGDTLILRGDSLAVPDPPIVPSQVLGVVTAAERAGKAISLARTPAKLLLSLAIRHSNLCRRLLLQIHGATPFVQEGFEWVSS